MQSDVFSLKVNGQDFDFRDRIKPKSIRIKDAENVAIRGRGIIDASGRVLRDFCYF